MIEEPLAFLGVHGEDRETVPAVVSQALARHRKSGKG